MSPFLASVITTRADRSTISVDLWPRSRVLQTLMALVVRPEHPYSWPNKGARQAATQRVHRRPLESPRLRMFKHSMDTALRYSG